MTTLAQRVPGKVRAAKRTSSLARLRKAVTRLEVAMSEMDSGLTPLEKAQVVTIAAERSLRSPASARSPMATALVRGVEARQRLKEAEGGALSVEESRPFFGGISRQAVLDRFKKGRLVGWREGRQNAVRLPRWQFGEEGVLPQLEEVLAILREGGAVDDWGVVLFFLTPRHSLGGQRPLDLLRSGEDAMLKRVARQFVES